MARTLILAIGVVMWAAVAIAMVYLYSIGHWVSPTVTLMIGIPLMAIRVRMRTRRRSAVIA